MDEVKGAIHNEKRLRGDAGSSIQAEYLPGYCPGCPAGYRMKTEPIAPDAEVEALLLEAGLPVSDLSGKATFYLLGARKDCHLLGVVGVEAYGSEGLLRSLAVTPAARGTGLGQHLVSEAEAWAAARGIKALYLLTATADEFFLRLGYKFIARDQAPASIAATAEFRELCPAAAAFMRKALAAENSREQPWSPV